MAYSTFQHLIENTEAKPASLLYNWALCQYAASEYSKAINFLNEVQSKITDTSSFSQPSAIVPTNLYANEYSNNAHLFALTETAILLNINLVKLRIRRLLVDCHLKLENWPEILRLSALPEMERCINVQEAVAITKTNTRK